MIGWNPNGALIEAELANIRNLGIPTNRYATNLFDALVEMFPDLSKTEIRRLIEGGSLRGFFAEKPTLEEAQSAHLYSDKYDFCYIQLGKKNMGGVSIPRMGCVLLSKPPLGIEVIDVSETAENIS